MEEQTLNKNGLMKAVQQLAGQAATEVHNEERQRQYEQYQQLIEQQPQQNLYSQPYWQTTTATANTFGQLANTTAANMKQAYQNVYAGGSGVPVNPSYYTTTGYVQSTPTLAFTDDQMTSFMDKLANLLSKGWECIRCHRIWNPRETGCEFCNFIDRLEGKDVERDTAA